MKTRWDSASIERRARSELKWYHDCFKKSNAPTLSQADIESLIRRRLAHRAQGRWPKNMGDLNIFLVYPHTDWEAVLPEALSSFGNVHVFEWKSRGYNCASPNWELQRDRMNSEMLSIFKERNEQHKIDAVVGMLSGHNTDRKTLIEMKTSGAAVFNFCFDDKIDFSKKKFGRYYSQAEFADVVDINLTSSKSSLIKYSYHNGLSIFFPEAALPDIHRPIDADFKFDVTFVGNASGWRPYFIKKLSRLGIHIECFGKGWPNGPVSLEEMITIFSISRINLGMGFNGSAKNLLSLKGRDFEIPMCGGLYLTQDNDELYELYDVGTEIVTYRDAQECAEKIEILLKKPDMASKIRLSGRSRALKDHSYEVRWGKIFKIAGLINL